MPIFTECSKDIIGQIQQMLDDDLKKRIWMTIDMMSCLNLKQKSTLDPNDKSTYKSPWNQEKLETESAFGSWKFLPSFHWWTIYTEMQKEIRLPVTSSIKNT